MRMMMFGGIVLLVLMALPVEAQVCSTNVGYDWLPDTDCDTVPDKFDNCPYVPNSLQEDRNRNGVGDYCDVLIDYITVMPDSHLRQGQFAQLGLTMINNQGGPINDIVVQVTSKSLNIDQETKVTLVPISEQGKVDFWIKIPKCAKIGQHYLTITTSFTEPFTTRKATETFQEPIIVEEGDVCGLPDGGLDNTIVEVFNSVRMDRSSSAIIPVKITNFGDTQTLYHVMVDDLGTWGTWRVSPEASVVLPSGKSATQFLRLETEPFTPAGTKPITIRVSTDDQQSSTTVNVYVRAPVQRAQESGTFLLELGLIVLALLVAGFILAIAVMHFSTRHEPVAKHKPIVKKTTRKKAKKKVAVENVKKSKRKTYY